MIMTIIWYAIQGYIIEDLQERLEVDCNDETYATQNEMSGLVEGICNSQNLSFYQFARQVGLDLLRCGHHLFDDFKQQLQLVVATKFRAWFKQLVEQLHGHAEGVSNLIYQPKQPACVCDIAGCGEVCNCPEDTLAWVNGVWHNL